MRLAVRQGSFCRLLEILLAFAWCGLVSAERWPVLGPDGGDARSLAYDPLNPERIYLGTGTGTIFLSENGGRTWSRLAQLKGGDDYVLDHIIVDRQEPQKMFVAAWSTESAKRGGIFRSRDGGRTWEALPDTLGKSIHALAAAASDRNVLIAGTLEGVYRSTDGGETWGRMSPENHAQIRNIESIAIDPMNPTITYAGTWHLAWKTVDGGITWRQISKGMVSDSDVFSLIVDASNPSVIFASACSGIYRSESAGESFHKVQGIPFSARRTRVLKQDLNHRGIVYAGTTEGLWKTADGGATWKRLTNAETVVNDILIDPRNSDRILLATDRGGILASDDAGRTFLPTNGGYTHRIVTAMIPNRDEPNTIFVAVANDREWGGVFSFRKGDQGWEQKNIGLAGPDVYTLKQSANGSLIAGTNRGIFILRKEKDEWRPSSVFSEAAPLAGALQLVSDRQTPDRRISAGLIADLKVNEVDVREDRWFAATPAGLLTSLDQGRSWNRDPTLGKSEFIAVYSRGNLVVAATRSEVMISRNRGLEWQRCKLPENIVTIRTLTITAAQEIVVGSWQGGLRSHDIGETWDRMLNGLPDRDISSISYDEESSHLYATSLSSSTIYESSDGGRSWSRGPDSGYPLRYAGVIHGHLVGVTRFDGVILQP